MWLPRKSLARKVVIATALSWTVVLAGLFAWTVNGEIRQTIEQASHQTRTFFKKFLLTRFWNAMHGGVYVVITEDTPPNPYLEDPLRDVTTLEGVRLTKMNPSYMTRQIAQIAAQKGEFHFHITSLDPIRPANKPDQWEKNALQAFAAGSKEIYEIYKDDTGEKVFRYMGPLQVEETCLSCHGKYGAKVGDINGGISVTLPAQPMLESQNRHITLFAGAYFMIWFIGMSALWFSFNKICEKEDAQESIIRKLEEALQEVKKLSGMLPICSTCMKIRDDQGYWQSIEKYIRDHSEAEFTHGICPECAEKLYPGMLAKIRAKKEVQEKKNTQTNT